MTRSLGHLKSTINICFISECQTFKKPTLLLKVHLLILIKLPGVYKISFSCETTVNRRDPNPSKLRMQASAVRMSLGSFKLLCGCALVHTLVYTDHLKEKWKNLEEQVELLNNSCLNTGKKKNNGKRKRKKEEFQWRISYSIILIMSLLEHTRTNALGCKITPCSTEWIKFS